ncbi:hypothetical protein JKP88DRAFT_149136, partial [Tribonema minus]
LDEAGLTDDTGFAKFAEACEQKGFFVGCDEDDGGLMWMQRFRKMVGVYQRSPDDRKAEHLKSRASHFVRVGDIPRAIACYNEAIQLVPEGEQTHVILTSRAALLCREGDVNGALSDCKRAAALRPTYAKAYSRMGFVYACMERTEDAVAAYERAVALDPTDPSN